MEQTVIPGCGISLDERVQTSIDMLRYHAPKDGAYYGCFSGGKDSVVVKELAHLAGVPVTWHYNVTTIDPPELVRFIKRSHPDVVWVRNPKGPFFYRMAEKAEFPTRRVRWCCREYKEQGGRGGATLVMGVRAEESPRRAASWRDVTYWRTSKSWIVSPILRWSHRDVWGFIHSRKLSYCKLYDNGYDRLGCVGCPMSRNRKAELEAYPGFKKGWMRAFRLVWEKRAGTKRRDGGEWFGSARFNSWEELWEWWLSNDPLPSKDGEECQMDMWT